MIAIWIILGLIVVLVAWGIIVFNSIVTLRNRTKEAWSDIDVQLKRRHDLIPNLIETVKGYATHEKELFEKVTQARADAINAKGAVEAGKAENVLTGALKSVFAVAENYPQLRATENFQKLQDELTDTENKIEASRRFYNANVRDFNIKIQVFPNTIFAKMIGTKPFELFEVTEASEKEVPQVKF
jgi:LemA protein